MQDSVSITTITKKHSTSDKIVLKFPAINI